MTTRDVVPIYDKSRVLRLVIFWRYFHGKGIPTEEFPESLRILSENAAYVALIDEGAVIVTTGIGSWRGGYLINPPNVEGCSSFSSRKIMSGVYFVKQHS